MSISNVIWDELSDTCLLEVNDAGVPQAVYTHEPTLRGAIISQRVSNATVFYCMDNESTRQITSATGGVIAQYTYTRFGEIVDAIGDESVPFRFLSSVGFYTDELSPSFITNYLPWMYYDPVLGIPLSQPFSVNGTMNGWLNGQECAAVVTRDASNRWQECVGDCRIRLAIGLSLAALLSLDCFVRHFRHYCHLLCAIFPASPVCASCTSWAMLWCLIETHVFFGAAIMDYNICLRRCGPAPVPPPTPIPPQSPPLA